MAGAANPERPFDGSVSPTTMLGFALGMGTDVDLAPFEGLIYATAKRYADDLDDDLDDIRQVLRIKVWKTLVAFEGDRARIYAGDLEKARESFVFSCLRNLVKDLLKQQYRLNERRRGTALHIEDLTDDLGSFEGRYMSVEDQEIHELVEGSVQLPSTLSELERALVKVLLTGDDFTRAEIALRLGVGRKRVLAIHRSVQAKLADWAPDGHAARSLRELIAA